MYTALAVVILAPLAVALRVSAFAVKLAARTTFKLLEYAKKFDAENQYS